MPTTLKSVPAHVPNCRIAAGDPEAQFDAACLACKVTHVSPWEGWNAAPSSDEPSDDTGKVVA